MFGQAHTAPAPGLGCSVGEIAFSRVILTDGSESGLHRSHWFDGLH